MNNTPSGLSMFPSDSENSGAKQLVENGMESGYGHADSAMDEAPEPVVVIALSYRKST
jgi:hypothetical protein